MSNQLQYESSPYLLQHKDNPVNWMPWGEEAFARARREDKPVFLSIGYSTCHWCHVMAHESFEDEEIAAILNESYVSIKVDKEERPDIDSIYMAACQALTGSGGWPTSIFMTAEQKPFFAGTYFPKTGRFGMLGLRELLLAVRDTWETNLPKSELEQTIELQIAYLTREAGQYPYAHAMFLVALSDWLRPQQMITAVYRKAEDIQEIKQCFKYIPSDCTVRIVQGPTEEYPLLKERVSYYLCENRSCLPPMNQAEFLKHLGVERRIPEL